MRLPLLLASAALLLHASPALAQESRAGPIIGDDEFDRTIPPIDENLDAPMPSIQEWEAKQRDLEAEAQAEDVRDGVASLPAAQDGDTGELLADPPINDPEIDDPLTPLSQFDVTPIDESEFTEEEDDSGSPKLRYAWRIDGLDDLKDDSEVASVDGDDILSRFKSVAALEKGDGKAANGAMVSARLQEDEQLLLDVMSSEGYFDATVTGSVKLPEQEGGELTVIMSVAPGPRYDFGSINFAGTPLVPEDLASKNFEIEEGEPIVADRVLAAEANVAVELPENGYPFAKLGDRDILLDPETGTGDYTLPIDAGPRSSFGDFVTSGTTAFGADHVAVLARFEKGELYDSKKVDDLRQALVATGLFSLVSVTPEKTGEPGPDGTEYARLSIEQEAGPPRTIAAEGGYGTGEGFRAEASWTHRNMFPPEGALSFSGLLGTKTQSLAGRFRRSNAGKRDRSVELGVSVARTDFAAYGAYTGGISGKISRVSTPIWQKKLTYSFGFELLASSEKDYDFVKGERDRQLYSVFALPAEVTFDQSDDLLNPMSGFRLTAKLSPEASLGSGSQFYARGLLEGTGYFPVSNALVLAGRARVGSILNAKRARIAPSRRFYGGGGGSVRGFGYQKLGPQDPDGDPIGGRSLVEGAAEVRYRFGNYGVVGFVDAGQVYKGSTPGFDNIRFGAGIGGRYYTNFGPMRLDVATPINRKPGESRIAIYVSIGQAF